ncbi:MAG TPA: BadF/BadG/BcrA/BcrD ATPase family protein [Gaiellaceae bacterium]|nr:BadF/BadG/BcrA/BcrD ATPase family protein [Gaiellaceae bacterium]
MSGRVVLAVDGGNSKTDLALVREDGELLALARGGGSSPHHLGIDRAFDVLGELFARAAEEARVEAPVAVAQLLLAGVDFPREVNAAVEHAANRGWALHTTVDNDTFAVLRAGTDRGWGVAIVCGAGINCVGVAPDGRHTRFPALGPTTGDWGGGYDLGIAAVSAAARSEDGRGPLTSLERAVPAHFGCASPSELAESIHFGAIDERRVVELAPVVLAEAADDPVAASIRDTLAGEVVALARVALARLDLTEESVDVVLGGGIFQSGDAGLVAAVAAGLGAVAPRSTLHVAEAPPVLGAALLGLDELGAPAAALARVRGALAAPEPVRSSGG